MAQYLAEERLDSEGEPIKKTRAAVRIKKRPQARKSNKKVKHHIIPVDKSDSSDDSDFISGSSESDSPVENEPLTNAEVRVATMCLPNYEHANYFIQLADVLPTKSVPQTGRQSSKKRKRRVTRTRAVVMEEVEDQDSPQRLSARSQSPLDPSTILEEAPAAVLHSSASEGNKKTIKVSVSTSIFTIC